MIEITFEVMTKSSKISKVLVKYYKSKYIILFS